MTTPSGVLQAVADQLRDALDPLDLDALSALLDDNVRWGGNQDRAAAASEGITLVQAPRDEPWDVREMLAQHPDGHMFRISQASQTGH